MDNIVKKEFRIGRSIKPYTGGNIEYRAHILTSFCCYPDWIDRDIPDEFIATALLEEMRRYVNSIEMKDVILDELKLAKENNICWWCGQPCES